MAIAELKLLAAMWGAPRPVRPPAASEPDPAQSPDLPYDLAQQTLQRQLDAADSLDEKTTNAFTAAVALVALLAAVFALRQDSLGGWNAAWFFASLIPLAIIAAISAVSTKARSWRTGPKASQVIEQYRRLGDDETVMKWKATRNLVASIELNDEALTLKSTALNAANLLVILEAVFAIAALFSLAT